MKRRKRLPPALASLHIFPTWRHRNIVDVIARGMRAIKTADEAEDFLIDHLTIEAGRLSDLGVADPEVERHIAEFAEVAWSAAMRGIGGEDAA